MEKLITLTTLCVSFMSAIASVFAVRYTYLAYKRDQKFDNENFVFQNRYKSYSLIVGDLNRLLTKIQTTLEEIEGCEDEDELNLMADEIDDSIYEFDNLVSEHSFSMSDKLIEQLDKITDLMLVGVDEEDEQKLNKTLDTLILKANELAAIMREELHVDNLSVSLTKRIRAR